MLSMVAKYIEKYKPPEKKCTRHKTPVFYSPLKHAFVILYGLTNNWRFAQIFALKGT